ncbi:MAG: hypothetical protein ACJAZX_000854 [Rickettsiales bacterium]|jgi:hypothetical protein
MKDKMMKNSFSVDNFGKISGHIISQEKFMPCHAIHMRETLIT